MIDLTNPDTFLEFFSAIAIIVVIGVLAIMYTAYYWQTNYAKKRRAETMKNKSPRIKSGTQDMPAMYSPFSSTESR